MDEAPDDPVIEQLGSKDDQAMNVDNDSDHDEVDKQEFGFEDSDDEHDSDSNDGLYDWGWCVGEEMSACVLGVSSC